MEGRAWLTCKNFLQVGHAFSFGKTREAQRFYTILTDPKSQNYGATADATREKKAKWRKEHMTRKFLEDLGLEKEVIDKILDENSADIGKEIGKTNTAKSDLAAAKGELETVRKELNELKATGDWKEKHDKVKKEFDDYKASQTAKESKAAKEAAARAYFQSKNITGKALEIAMRGSSAEIEALVLEDGKIKDTKALDGLVAGDFSGLVGTTTTTGANTATPPANTGGESKPVSRAAELYNQYYASRYGAQKGTGKSK